jgi:hypothetical protein
MGLAESLRVHHSAAFKVCEDFAKSKAKQDSIFAALADVAAAVKDSAVATATDFTIDVAQTATGAPLAAATVPPNTSSAAHTATPLAAKSANPLPPLTPPRAAPSHRRMLWHLLVRQSRRWQFQRALLR